MSPELWNREKSLPAPMSLGPEWAPGTMANGHMEIAPPPTLSWDVGSVPRASSQRWPRANSSPRCPLSPTRPHVHSADSAKPTRSWILHQSFSKGLCKNLFLSIFFAAQRKRKMKDRSPTALAGGLRGVQHWPGRDRCYFFPCVLGRLLWPVSSKLAKQGSCQDKQLGYES